MTDNDLDDSLYLGSLPYGSDVDPQEKVLCAATAYGDTILCGVRHGDSFMSSIFETLDSCHFDLSEQCGDDEVIEGFVTTKGRFVDRQQAWKIALANKQIIRIVGGNNRFGGTLYSENLY